MEIAGWVFFITIFAIVAIAIIQKRKDRIEELYHNGVGIKALRLSELSEIIHDPSKTEKLRDAAREEIQRRSKAGLL